MEPCIYFSLAATFIYYSVLAYKDWKEREIDVKIFYAAVPFILIANYLCFSYYGISVLLNAAIALISFALIFIFSVLGLMGRGDAFIISFIFLLNPFPVFFLRIPIFPGFIAIVFSFLYPLYTIMRNIFINARNFEKFRHLTKNMGKLEKAYYFLFAETMKKEDFLKKKFYFPLVSSNMKRIHADMEKDPLSPSKYRIEGEYVIASYGIPLATASLIGYAVFAILLLLDIASPFP